MILLTDEELSKFVEFPIEGYTSDRRGVAKAQLKKVVDNVELLEPPVIKARDKVAFYAGYQRAREDWQALLKEIV